MKSDNINELANALSKLQGALEGAKKDSTNPFYKSKYADLESIWEAARPLLQPNGLAVTQTMDCIIPSPESGPITLLVTTLMHTSGQWVSGMMPLLLKQADPQGQGSAISYARRYALAAILGIHQTDDDAESSINRSGAAIRTNPKAYEKPSHTQTGVEEQKKATPEEVSKEKEAYPRTSAEISKSIEERGLRGRESSLVSTKPLATGNNSGHVENKAVQKTTEQVQEDEAPNPESYITETQLLKFLEMAQENGYEEEEVSDYLTTKFEIWDGKTLYPITSENILKLTNRQLDLAKTMKFGEKKK